MTGHHDVHQDQVDVRHGFKLFQGFKAVAADLHDGALLFECAGECEDIAHVVIHQQDAAAFEYPVAAAHRLQHVLALAG
jgi:hypothetical protein